MLRGKLERKEKEPKYTRHLIKALVHGQPCFIVLGSVEQGFLKGKTRRFMAEGCYVQTEIQWKCGGKASREEPVLLREDQRFSACGNTRGAPGTRGDELCRWGARDARRVGSSL